MDRPDAASVRVMSKVNFDDLGYSDDTDLQVVVDQANAYFEWVTGRPLDTTMPSGLAPLAAQAVRMRSEQVAFQAQEDYVDTATDDVISSFSAGTYSETRRDPTKRILVNSWGALNDLLWMAMTPEKYDYWQELLSGVIAPSFEITEVAWSHAMLGEASDDVPWLVEPRASREGIIDLDAWGW